MPLKRYIVELGTGADLHGGDNTKAAKRAIKDAVSHSCLCGLMEVAGMKDPNEMVIKAKVACPYPEKLDKEEVKRAIPFGSAEIEVVQGGLETRGMHVGSLGEGDLIVVALVSLTVYVDVKE